MKVQDIFKLLLFLKGRVLKVLQLVFIEYFRNSYLQFDIVFKLNNVFYKVLIKGRVEQILLWNIFINKNILIREIVK